MIIPSTKQKPTNNYEHITMLLYGPPKIGKSTFCSRFENAFFVATEPGLNFLETYNLRANSWDEAWEIIEALTESPIEFTPIVIDTIDKLWDFCCEEIARQNGVKSVGMVGFGRGYDQAQFEFKKYIQALVNFNVGLIFTSHTTFVEVPNPTSGEPMKMFVPSVDKRVRAIINPLVDIIGYISTTQDYDEKAGKRVEKRVFHARESLLWEAGDRTHTLPEEFPFSQPIYKSFFNTPKE
jgi:GTPase SAR1 family protein